MSEARLQHRDDAELWLYENDPRYDTVKYNWQVTRKDALACENRVRAYVDDWLQHQPDTDGNFMVSPAGEPVLLYNGD
jgi:hypothetical protein